MTTIWDGKNSDGIYPDNIILHYMGVPKTYNVNKVRYCQKVIKPPTCIHGVRVRYSKIVLTHITIKYTPLQSWTINNLPNNNLLGERMCQLFSMYTNFSHKPTSTCNTEFGNSSIKQLYHYTIYEIESYKPFPLTVKLHKMKEYSIIYPINYIL